MTQPLQIKILDSKERPPPRPRRTVKPKPSPLPTDSGAATADIIPPEYVDEAGDAAKADKIRQQVQQLPSASPDRPLIEAPDKPVKSEPKSGVPSVDEWQDFIGRILIRSASQAYIAVMLRDFDLTPQEEESIALTKEDLKEMSAPFASAASKNKWTRKHGREIIALADSWEALLSMAIWSRRVSRIARKHRKTQPRPIRQRQQPTGRHSHLKLADTPEAAPTPNFVFMPGGTDNESAGTDAGERAVARPPDPIGYVDNPGSG